MSHTDLPGCHEQEVDTHVKLFTQEAPGNDGCLVMSSRCEDTIGTGIVGRAAGGGGPCVLAGLGRQDRDAGSSGFSGGGRSGGCLVLGLDLDILSGAGGCRAWVQEPCLREHLVL